MNATVLATDKRQILTHQSIIRVGESLRQQQLQAVEEDKRRAVLCTEEVVRREETCKQEQQLTTAKDGWKKERQQLFQEAHHNQLRAIARQTTILEETLRKEFASTVAKLEEEHRLKVNMIIQRTWGEADEVKEKAIDDTRHEEQERAKEEACRVAEKVEEERILAAEMAAREREQALENQRQQLGQVQTKALDDQKRELEKAFDDKLSEVSCTHSAKLTELEGRYSEQKATAERLERELNEMRGLKEEWEEKYQNLKVEFSDFIDQFPGFKGDFLLK